MDAHPERDFSRLLQLMADDPGRRQSRPVRRRFLQLLAALERTSAHYAICGAVAMGAHGARRFTEEIDVLVDDRDLEGVIAALSKSMREVGREPANGPAKQVRLRSRRARSAAGVDIDIMAPIDVAEAWALATSVRARAFGRKVDVVSAEGLVVLKLRAYLSDSESRAGGKHRVDALTLLQTVTVDLPALRQFVAGHPELAAELDRCLAAPPPRGRLG